ncbi:MAG: hypothetical protein KDJ55_04025 [Rhodobiaceae bacterium]|nr:hypothetical protein [Rhodobiaceae bacterium]MCC0012928.1 hypothetical protein [Rhodobiaceae bacterium]MCC0018951.1 hypothetical protein [Rhodobiaceae bacterium]MCC0060045.1 hypothetical protein [Rhodobiaceae bacterium]
MIDTKGDKGLEAGDDVLRRMLNTPPDPKVEKPAKQPSEKIDSQLQKNR